MIVRSILVIGFASVVFAGQANAQAPTPQNINGQYFLGGDAVCTGYKQTSPTTIECYNSYGQLTQTRGAMDARALQGWLSNETRLQESQAKQAERAAMFQSVIGALDSLGQTANQVAQTYQNQAVQMPLPQVGPYGQPRNTITGYCNNLTDNLTTCRVR